MESTTKARKIGNSIGVLIPEFAARGLRISAGTPLKMIITDKEIIVRLKYAQKKAMLDYIDTVIEQGITEDIEV